MTSIDMWQRRFERERSARHQAEMVLESKSRELYELNKSLEISRANLEKQVAQRTAALESLIGKLKEEIGKREEVERELRVAHDSALELSDLKSQFIARMSHEVRTPLNAVIGLTGLLLDSDLSEEQTTHLQTVRSSGNLLLRIINDILDLSKIDANKIELEYMPVRIAYLVEQSLSLVMLEAEKKGINFELNKVGYIPKEVVVDGGRVQQLLLNLLSNAVRYSGSDTVKVTVSLDADVSRLTDPPEGLVQELAANGNHLQMLNISVEDRGVGIDSDNLDSLFDPFTQFGGATTGSSGLGLTICQRLCRIMGGDISVASRVGKGSSFTIQVLCAVQTEAHSERGTGSETTKLQSTSETGAWLLTGRLGKVARQKRSNMAKDKPLTILLADDYKVNRMVQQAQLEQLGYRADAVANGEEVLRALYARSYDVVLMDIQMPVMDGVEATRRIRERKDGPQPFIVAVTASALSEDRANYMRAGMDAYLAKPVEIDALVDVLDEASAAVGHGTNASVPAAPATLNFDSLYSRLGSAADGLLSKVIPVFLRELPGRVKNLQHAFDSKDAQAMAQICHGLKGASRSIGATELAQTCESLEQLGYAEALPDGVDFQALLDLIQRTGLELRDKLQSLETAEPAA